MDKWEYDLVLKYIEWYDEAPDSRAVWVKEGILESYKVVTDTYKTQVAGVIGGALSFMVAQLASGATILPLYWNLLIVGGALCFAIFIHFRMSHKVSILNASMGGVTKVTKGPLVTPTVRARSSERSE